MTPANIKALHNKHIIKCFVYISTKWVFLIWQLNFEYRQYIQSIWLH